MPTKPSDPNARDVAFMRQCLELAREASERGESPVGSIVSRGERVIARAGEAVKAGLDVTAHAEVLVLRAAARVLESMDLDGCTLYTNVEPCVLCSYAIRKSRIERVVIGAPTGALGGVSSSYAILTDSSIVSFGEPPIVVEGVLLDACRDLLAASHARPGRP